MCENIQLDARYELRGGLFQLMLCVFGDMGDIYDKNEVIPHIPSVQRDASLHGLRLRGLALKFFCERKGGFLSE